MSLPRVYACDSCPATFASLRELTQHYEKEHPEMMEKLIVPN